MSERPQNLQKPTRLCGCKHVALFSEVSRWKPDGFPRKVGRLYSNAAEAVHRLFRKLTKKGCFPNENSLLKLLYEGDREMESPDAELESSPLAIGDSL